MIVVAVILISVVELPYPSFEEKTVNDTGENKGYGNVLTVWILANYIIAELTLFQKKAIAKEKNTKSK